MGEARLLSIGYALLSSAVAAVLYIGGAAPPGRRPASLRAAGNRRYVWFVISVASLLAVTGFLLQAYDKIVIQGIDYSGGIGLARSEWQLLGEERQGGVSSLASTLGNLAAPSFLVALSLLHLHWEVLVKRQRWTGMLAVLVTLAATSFLTSGRSILLLSLAVLGSTALIRRACGQRVFPGSRPASFRAGVTAAALLLGSMSWFIYVFHARAQASQLPARAYSDAVLVLLRAESTPQYDAIDRLPGATADAGYFLTAVAAYATHSLYAFEGILTDQERPGNVLGRYLEELLNKTRLVRLNVEPWLFDGLFISLPGGLYYDLGWLGLLVGAVIHGVALGGAMLLVARGGIGGGGFAAVIAVLTTSLLAPLIPAFLLLMFPFMVLDVVVVHLIARSFFHPRSWLPWSPILLSTGSRVPGPRIRQGGAYPA